MKTNRKAKAALAKGNVIRFPMPDICSALRGDTPTIFMPPDSNYERLTTLRISTNTMTRDGLELDDLVIVDKGFLAADIKGGSLFAVRVDGNLNVFRMAFTDNDEVKLWETGCPDFVRHREEVEIVGPVVGFQRLFQGGWS